jgi:hypothetical protein
VKTLTDGAAPRVRLDSVAVSTVAEQRRMPGARLGADEPRLEGERTVYWIDALLVGYGRAPSGAYRLLLRDADRPDTMLAEIPDPDCSVVTRAGIGRLFTTARHWVDSLGPLGPAITALPTPLPVSVVGVGIYDNVGAPSGTACARVLQPVLSIGPRFVAGQGGVPDLHRESGVSAMKVSQHPFNSGQVRIETAFDRGQTNVTAALFDMRGGMVRDVVVPKNSTKTMMTAIAVVGLPDGVYMAAVYTPAGVAARRLVYVIDSKSSGLVE